LGGLRTNLRGKSVYPRAGVVQIWGEKKPSENPRTKGGEGGGGGGGGGGVGGGGGGKMQGT